MAFQNLANQARTRLGTWWSDYMHAMLYSNRTINTLQTKTSLFGILIHVQITSAKDLFPKQISPDPTQNSTVVLIHIQ